MEFSSLSLNIDRGWLWDFDLRMDFYQDQELKANH